MAFWKVLGDSIMIFDFVINIPKRHPYESHLEIVFHLITHSVKSLLGHLGMSSWSISSRAFLSSVCGPTMLVLWSDLILHTGHHLTMNFRTVFMKEFISSKCAVFICTPLLAKHVNSTLWHFTSFMPCFIRNGPNR